MKNDIMVRIIESSMRCLSFNEDPKTLYTIIDLFKGWIFAEDAKTSDVVRVGLIEITVKCKNNRNAHAILSLAKELETCYFEDNSGKRLESKEKVNKTLPKKTVKVSKKTNL